MEVWDFLATVRDGDVLLTNESAVKMVRTIESSVSEERSFSSVIAQFLPMILRPPKS